MNIFNTETLFSSGARSAIRIQTTYTEPYTERDYTPHHTVSFPVQSCFGYRAEGEMFCVDDNTVLFERQQTEFSVRKFKTFSTDATLSIVLPDAPEIFDTLLAKERRAAIFRRTPGMEFLLRRFLGATARGNRLLQEHGMYELLDATLRHPLEIKKTSEGLNAFQKRPVDIAKEFIHAKCQESLGIADIAGAAHVSPFHFSRLFRRATGYSPYEYLLLTRLERAKGLLQKGMPVGQTAFETGFNSLENFSLAFKKANGCAPVHFQKSKIY